MPQEFLKNKRHAISSTFMCLRPVEGLLPFRALQVFIGKVWGRTCEIGITSALQTLKEARYREDGCTLHNTHKASASVTLFCDDASTLTQHRWRHQIIGVANTVCAFEELQARLPVLFVFKTNIIFHSLDFQVFSVLAPKYSHHKNDLIYIKNYHPTS